MAILGYAYGARQLADARSSFNVTVGVPSSTAAGLLPCQAAAAQWLPPRAVVSCSGQGPEAEGAASAARSPGRGSRLGRPVWHATGGLCQVTLGLASLSVDLYIHTH